MQILKECSDCIMSYSITWFLGFVQRLPVKEKRACLFEHVVMDKVQKIGNPKS